MLFPAKEFNEGKVISIFGKRYAKDLVNWGNDKAELEPVIAVFSDDFPNKINAYVQFNVKQLTSDKWEVEEKTIK